MATVGELDVKLGVDNRELERGLKEAAAIAKKGAGEAAQAFDKQTAATKKTTEAVKQQTSTLVTLNDELNEAKREMFEYIDAEKRAGNIIKRNNIVLDEKGNVLEDASSKLANYRSRTAEAERAVRNHFRAEKSANDALDKKTTALQKTSPALGGMGRNAGQAAIQIQQFVGQVQGGQSALLAFSQQSADLGFVLGVPLIGAVLGIAGALAGPLLAALTGVNEATKEVKLGTDDWVTNLKERLAEAQGDTTSFNAIVISEYNKLNAAYNKNAEDIAFFTKRQQDLAAQGVKGTSAFTHTITRLREENEKLAQSMETLTQVSTENLATQNTMEAEAQKDIERKEAALQRQLEFDAKRLIQQQIYAARMAVLQQEQADREAEIKQQQADRELAIQQAKEDAATAMAISNAQMALNSFGQHSKKMFKVAKVANVAIATMEGYKSAVSAWKWGMDIGGPPLAAAFTAASLAKTAALIKSITSASFSGGGGSSSAGGGASAPAAGAPAAPAEPQRSVTLNITGDSLFNAEQVRNLIGQINEQVGDGVELNVGVA